MQIENAKITRNAAKCRNCETVIESSHVHDWVSCICFRNEVGNQGIFIDGGLEYIRRGGCLENLIDMSEPSAEIRYPKPLTEQEVPEANERQDKMLALREEIFLEVGDLVSDFLVYARKDDTEITVNVLAEAFKNGTITIEMVTKKFEEELRKQMWVD